jgi:hypothetical protein
MGGIIRKITVCVLGAQMENYVFPKLVLLVKWISLLFGIQQPEVVYCAKISSILKKVVKVNQLKARMCNIFKPLFLIM